MKYVEQSCKQCHIPTGTSAADLWEALNLQNQYVGHGTKALNTKRTQDSVKVLNATAETECWRESVPSGGKRLYPVKLIWHLKVSQPAANGDADAAHLCMCVKAAAFVLHT